LCFAVDSVTFYDLIKIGAMPKLSAAADQTVAIAELTLRQDVLTKIGSMNRSKAFRFGQQPLWEGQER